MRCALNINKKRFFFLFAASGCGLVSLILLLLVTGSGYAAFPITGVGGVVVEANQISGSNFKLWPKTGQTEFQDNWGQAHVELGSAAIDGLVMSKTFSLDGAFSQYGISSIEIAVASNAAVKGENVKLGVTGIAAL